MRGPVRLRRQARRSWPTSSSSRCTSCARSSPPDRVLLDDITLAFLPGAKIGVLGANGAGKSTLLRIMAGVDKEFIGEAQPRRRRARRLPAAGAAARRRRKDVLGNVEEGVAEIRALLHRFEEVCAQASASRWTTTRWPRCSRSRRKLQDQIDARQRLGARPHARDRDGRAAPAAGRRRRRDALRRRAAPRRALPAAARRSPTCCCSTSRPTTSTPSRSPGSSASCRSTRARSSPSPTTATSSTTSPAGSSSSTAAAASRGRATTPPGSSRSRSAWRSEEKQASARQRTLQRELEWIRMSPRARQAKSKARLSAYEELRAEEEQRAPETVEIAIPPGPRLGDVVVEAEQPAQGLRRPAADRRPRRSRCRPAASSA